MSPAVPYVHCVSGRATYNASMSAARIDAKPSTSGEARSLGRKLGYYVFLPCIVFSSIAVFVGLANWEVEGPAFFICSMAALVASAWLFRAARRATGPPGDMLVACAVSCAGFGVAMFFFDAFAFVQSTLVFVFLAALGLRVARMRRLRPVPAEASPAV